MIGKKVYEHYSQNHDRPACDRETADRANSTTGRFCLHALCSYLFCFLPSQAGNGTATPLACSPVFFHFLRRFVRASWRCLKNELIFAVAEVFGRKKRTLKFFLQGKSCRSYGACDPFKKLPGK